MTYKSDSTREQSVAEFNKAAGLKTEEGGGSYLLMINCFAEELSEFNVAMADYINDPSEGNRAEMVKEMADVQVTLSNLAWFFDVDLEKAFDIVHKNNMSKVTGGRVFRREDGKIMKPEGYKPVDMRGL